jgi:putative sigma-54 modulation protein
MKLTVTGRHLEISTADRAQIASKVARLDRILNDSAMSAVCIVTRERQNFVLELTVHARGNHMLVGVGRDRRLTTAATLAVQKVAQQAKRLTDRWKASRDGRTARAASIRKRPAAAPPEPGSPEIRVIRTRGYEVKPMTVDDAVLLLTGGSQSFLVFRHAVSDAILVVYKRPDGHVGLIEPES